MNSKIPLLLTLAVLGLLVSPAFAQEPSAGRGLFYRVLDHVATQGYPDNQSDFADADWGVLYDENNVPYGPRSYYQDSVKQENSNLNITEALMETPWVRVNRSGCCSEMLMAQFLEVLDLQWHEMRDLLNYTPDRKINALVPAALPDYQAVTGREYWFTHEVNGDHIVFEPIDILVRRTLYGHVARAAMVQSFIDLKCHGLAPPWFREGLSSYLAEEGLEHLSFMGEFRPNREILLSSLDTIKGVYPLLERESARVARYNAFLMVWHLSENYGWDRVVALLDAMENGVDFAAAVDTVYGVEYARLLELIDPIERGEPTTVIPQAPR